MNEFMKKRSKLFCQPSASIVVESGISSASLLPLGVPLLEGEQHLLELFRGLGYFQPKRVKPRLVDPQLLRHRTVIAVLERHHAVDVAVGRRQHYDLRHL